MIDAQLLGGACLRAGDTALGGPPAQRHRIALLTLIIDAWPQPLSRDRALALLWPDRDEPGARRLLNLAVHVLRSALGETAITSVGDGLLLNPASVRSDLHDLRAAISRGDAEDVVRLYGGPLLDGFHLAESAEFSEWLDRRRLGLEQARIEALLTLADRHERAGDARALVAACRGLAAADPHSPAHALRLMRALDAAGDRPGALQHAAEHDRRLRRDLELEPDPAVAALAAELRRAPPRAPTAALESAPSVGVLPFVNLGGDPEHELFADGMTDDVIAHLSKIRSLRVISRGSVTPFKERQQTLKEIGRALGTTTLLDGTVRHAAGRVRIVATLVDVERDRQLWAETYDRELTDIFAIQTDVALRVAAALRAELSADERGRVRSEPTSDVRAYQFVLQARRWHVEYSLTGLRRAADLYERALALDPTFALAFASLSMALLEMLESGFTKLPVAGPRAESAAVTALRLDPALGEAHCAMGYLRALVHRDIDGAGQDFARAFELSPGGAEAYATYGRLLAGWGRYDEAIEMLRRSEQLDPLTNRSDLATALLRAGRYPEAIAKARAAAELDLAQDRARATLGWGYFLSGRRAEGIAELETAVALTPENPAWLAQLAEALALAGKVERARVMLRQLETMAQATFVSPFHLAYVHAGLGDADRALDLLERAATEGAGPIYAMRTSFLLAPLREHPRFQALCDGWSSAG